MKEREREREEKKEWKKENVKKAAKKKQAEREREREREREWERDRALQKTRDGVGNKFDHWRKYLWQMWEDNLRQSR